MKLSGKSQYKSLTTALALSVLLASRLIAADSVVVFNEIMYHPADTGSEWIELHNLFAIDVDVSKWSLRGGVQYVFPEETVIPANGFLVVTDSPAVLGKRVNSDQVYGPFIGKLSNSGEQLELWNNDNRIMDTVDYSDGGEWPVAPDGSGVTLAKLKPNTAARLAKNWTWSGQSGGTPGTTNLPDDEAEPVRHDLIGFHDSWRYDDSGGNRGISWRNIGYDDSSWRFDSASFYSGQTVIGDEPTEITTLYSTGYAGDGSVLSPGQPDPHYFITSNQAPLTVMQNHPAWIANDSFSTWIGLSSQGTDNQPAGNYSFSTTFDMSGWLAETAELNFTIAVDNELLDVRINSISTGITSIGHDAFTGPFTIDGGFISGVNKIDFEFQNWSTSANPMGLRINISGTAIPIAGRTEVSQGPVTHYFRKSFVYNGDQHSLVTVGLNHLVDDGAVFYLNGDEFHRYNMPPGGFDYLTPAESNIAEPAASGVVSIPVTNMIVGDNVLAVEVHQSIQNKDVLFDAAVSAIETSPPSVESIKVAFNEITSAIGSQFWVELMNYGQKAIELTDCVLVCAGTVSGEYTLAQTSLNAGDYLVLDSATLGFWPADEDRLFLYAPDKYAVLDAAVVKNSHRGRYPAATGRWQYPNTPTRGTHNNYDFNDDIVINEIMYNHCYLHGQEAESSEEWIELYNKSDETINLSGWKLKDDISYEFPDGSTIDGNEYVVIANNAIELARKYPDINIAGEYDGRLSNKTGHILLVDNYKNIADEVQYYDSKPWPDNADGLNASLELRQPDADNSKAMAWQASNESSKTSWKTYTYRGTAVPSPVGPDGQWHEFIIGLLDAGEILLDDVSVVEDPNGQARQLIQNGTFDSGTANKWRILGNHGHSQVIVDSDDPANYVLRFVATGPTGHMHNHTETTLAPGRSIFNGREYEVSFKAKWIAGSNQLNSRLYFNRVAKTTLIELPETSGTPGMQNSRYETNIGPTFSGFVHNPPVPLESEPVIILAAADDPDGVFGMVLSWRKDGQRGWNNVAMNIGADAMYRAQIPALTSSTVVQFYITATDTLGNSSTFPPEGADSRALYKVDDNLAANNGLNNFRFIMFSDDYTWMHTNINIMSNGRLGATVIYNEHEVFYDVGVRLKGSQRHRHEAENVGFNVRFPTDNLFNDVHKTVAIDRSEGVAPGQREMLIHITMNRAGSCQLSKYTDLIKVIAPAAQHTGSAELQLARFNSVFLNDQFEDGSDGQVYEYEYIYYPLTTLSGDREDYKLPTPDGVVGKTIRDYGDDKENYRWHFLKKNNRDQDYYQSLIDFAKVFGTTGSYFDDNISEIIDVDQWLRAFAISVACGAGDNYGGDNAQHNMQMYVRPSDGKTLYFPHDLDAFYSSTRPLIANNDLRQIIALPGYERLYYGHVYDVLNTSYNSAYMGHWTDQLGALLPSQAFGSHLSFIDQRNNYLLNEIAKRVAPAYSFEITGYDSIVADSHAMVSGKAWIDVKDVYLEGFERPLELSWTSTGSGTSTVFYWTAGVPLEPGENNLVFLVYDFQGDLITTEAITITSTIAERPLRDYLRVTEVMYNPIGGKEYEFIELYNAGPETLDLSDLKMVENEVMRFAFASSSVKSLAPDDYVLIVENLPAFSSRYGISNMNVAGEYSGKLSNGGESIEFKGMWDSPVLSFEYNDSRGWPTAADGSGHSIVPLDWVITSQGAGLLEYGGNWRNSTYIYGSPGMKDAISPVTIMLNEIMAHTDYSNAGRPEYDSNDWIELYNPTSASIHLINNDWFLSDDIENLKKWSIPETTISAGSWISFDEVTGFHNPITQGFGLNKAGEQLFLSYLPGTSDDRVVDSIPFKAQANSVSLGRYPDGGDFWYKMLPSSNATNNGPLDHIVISELMYYPHDEACEYVELYNPTAESISLWNTETTSGWRLDGGIGYVFSSEATIPAMGHLVVVPFEPNELSLSQFRSKYGNQASEILGPYNGSLSDRGERIALEEPEAADIDGQSNSWIIIDEVIYFHQTPWPTGAGGTGMAIWRVEVGGNGNDPSAWSTSSPKPGTIAYDFDASGTVDLADWAYIAECWMAENTDSDWNPEVNLDGGGSDIIDWSDMLIFLDHWLWTNR